MKFLPRHLSIRSQLLLLVLVVALPSVGFLSWYARHEADEARAAAYAKARLLAGNTAASLELMLRDYAGIMEQLAARPLVRQLDPKNCDPIISEHFALHAELTTVAVRDLQGNLICANRPGVPARERVAGFSWFQHGTRGDGFAVGSLYRGQSSGRWLAVLTYPILNGEEKPAGFIGLALDLRKLNERLFQPGSEPAVQEVIDGEGGILLRSIDAAAWIGKPLPAAQLAGARAAAAGYFVADSSDGTRRLYAVAAVPGTDWRAYAGLAEDEVLADYDAMLFRTMAISGGVLLLAFVLAWHLSSNISRPIRELAETAAVITGGNAAARAKLSGPAEIGYVAERFNAMLDFQERQRAERAADEAKIRRLSTAYATLSETNEAIVRLRTKEDLFHRVCRIAVQSGGYVGAWVGLADESVGRILPVAEEGSIGEYVRQIRISTDPAVAQGRGPIALAWREGAPQYCQDFLRDPITEPWHELAPRFGVRSMAALPLSRGGRVVGTLNLYSGEPEVFDAPMRALLEEMALDISFALQNFEHEAERQQTERALAQSEARFRDIIETAHDAFIAVSPRGQLLDANRAASELSGYSREQLLAMSLRELEAVQTDEEIAQSIAAVIAAGHARFEGTWRHREGRLLNVEISTTHLGGASGGYFFAFIRDITRRKRVEQALREGEARFRSMLEQNIAAMFMIEDGVITYANRRAGEILGYTAQELVGRPMLDFVAAADRGLAADALAQLVAGDIQALEREFRARRKDGSLIDVGAHASIVTLQGKKALLGIAQDIGERKKAQAEIERYIARLEHSMESTLRAVSLMVELRDPYTAGHERRVGDLAAAIGAEMALPEDTLKGLRLAGYVHDIGKISVPAEILSKPSQLTPMEFELIKGHSRSGYDVLKDVDFPWPVAEVILQHHERLDGSGYPRRLKGAEIIPEARIMAVADVIEAMSSHRPYRPGLGLEAALAEIEAKAGTLYDAQVVEACVRLFRDRGYALPT